MSEIKRKTDPGRLRSAALAIASGRAVADVARQTGLSAKTLFRWLKQPTFRLMVEEYRTKMFDEAVGILSRLQSKAAAKLEPLLDSANEKVRLDAIKAALDLGPKLRESTSLARRIEELERDEYKRTQPPILEDIGPEEETGSEPELGSTSVPDQGRPSGDLDGSGPYP